MKRFLQLLFSVCMLTFGFSQDLKPIAKKVANYKAAKKNFVKFSPFTKNSESKNAAIYKKSASDVTVMQLKSSELQKIVNERPESMELNFPFENGEITVELIKNDLFTPDFQVNTDKGVVAYTPGVYYQGIVKGDNTSVVAFSFFDDDVVGVASQLNLGNIVLGKAKNSEEFVSYNDRKLTEKNPFACGVEELPENQKLDISYDPTKKVSDVSNSCIRVYYEVGSGVYTGNSSNTTTTTNRVTAWFNNVKTLYTNESVNVAMSSIYIWTTSDSGTYSGQPGDILNQFRLHTTTFNGDTAQLLRTPATTSVAYLDSICNSAYRYSYVGVTATQNVALPTYSWNIMAMTHEMGHSLGSPHTHGCYWNGNNTAIDGCAPTYDPSLAEGTCPTGPIPSNGGTIMSYCHLVSAGINFANGFGPQPGDLIRQTIASKACLGSDCIASCDVTVSAMTLSNITKTSITVNITDATSTEWKYRLSLANGTVVKSGNSTSKSFVISDLSPNSFYKIEVGTNCSSAYQKTQMFLTEDDWCGKTITDTGGANGNYTTNESWTKTFYPDNPDQKLKLTFSDFNMASGDYLIVRNGLSTSPTFSGTLTGTTIPGPFTSTHSTGAITITFKSGTATAPGFKANFDCLVLGVSDVTDQKAVSVLPNPVKNQFRIEGKLKVENVVIFDASGKLIRQYDADSIFKNTYDVSKLKTGTYVITIKTDKETISKKLIKE